MAPRETAKSHSSLPSCTISHIPSPSTSKFQTISREPIPQRYSEIQESGALLQNWIEDSQDPTCPIKHSTLSLSDLKKQGWTYKTNIMDYSPEFEPEPYNDTPGSRKYEEIEISSFHKHKAKEGSYNLYQTLLGEGRIYAQDISREDGPYYSEIATALYKARAPIETLRHVYFDNVVNIDTMRFVKNRLYTAENGLNWPPDRSVMVWEYGTAEYQGLLGTRLGKVVAYIVLGAFPRETRYISKVSSFAGADYDYALHLRFDIEMIPVGLARGG